MHLVGEVLQVLELRVSRVEGVRDDASPELLILEGDQVEARDDAEVVGGALHGLEEIGVTVFVDIDNLAAAEDKLHLSQHVFIGRQYLVCFLPRTGQHCHKPGLYGESKTSYHLQARNHQHRQSWHGHQRS